MEQTNKKSFLSFLKHPILVCFLTSIPILILGLLAMIFLYKPLGWEVSNQKWLLPIMMIFYSLIVEAILVLIPFIMIRLSRKKDNVNNRQGNN